MADRQANSKSTNRWWDMRKILFLDCDGTIREPVDGKWIKPFDNQQIMQGVAEAIAHYHASGYLLVGISNQGGVAAGHKSLDDCIKEQQFTLSLTPGLHSIFFCPDYEGNSCYRIDQFGIIREYHRDLLMPKFPSFRKPGSGMVELIIDLMGSKAEECQMIGDRPEDEQCAAAADIPFMWADIWRNQFI